MDPEVKLEELLNEQRELDSKLKSLKINMGGKRKALRELSKKKRDIIDSIKIKNREANTYRAERDKLNKKVKTHKKARDKHNVKVKELLDDFKKLKDSAPPGNFKAMEKEINTLEWRLQTRVMEIKKEDEIVDKIKDLKTALKDYKEILEVSTMVDKHRRESKKLHTKILALSEESQKNHEIFLKAVEGIKELEIKIDDINKEKEGITPGLDEMRAEFNSVRSKNKELDKEIKDLEIEADLAVEEKSTDELKEEANVVYERFKKGDKLDLEDIYLLRRFNLV